MITTGQQAPDAITGEPMTMKIGSVGVNGKTYLLPFYDPGTRRVLGPKEVLNKFAPLIQAGEIEGYDSPEQAEADREIFYPQIIGDK